MPDQKDGALITDAEHTAIVDEIAAQMAADRNPKISIVQFFEPSLKPGMKLKVHESVLIAYLEPYGIKAWRTDKDGWQASVGNYRLWKTVRLGWCVAQLKNGWYHDHKYFADETLSTAQEFELALNYLNEIA